MNIERAGLLSVFHGVGGVDASHRLACGPELPAKPVQFGAAIACKTSDMGEAQQTKNNNDVFNFNLKTLQCS